MTRRYIFRDYPMSESGSPDPLQNEVKVKDVAELTAVAAIHVSPFKLRDFEFTDRGVGTRTPTAPAMEEISFACGFPFSSSISARERVELFDTVVNIGIGKTKIDMTENTQGKAWSVASATSSISGSLTAFAQHIKAN